jgi:hypothetical protein
MYQYPKMVYSLLMFLPQNNLDLFLFLYLLIVIHEFLIDIRFIDFLSSLETIRAISLYLSSFIAIQSHH